MSARCLIRSRRVASVLVGAVSLAGCGESDEGVSYSRDVKPIFDRNCVYCHARGELEGYAEGDLTDPFHPEYGMIAVPNTWYELHGGLERNIVPGDPETSFLMRKVTGTELVLEACDPNAMEGDDCPIEREGIRMPPPIPPLKEEQVALLRQWIADGATDGAFFRNSIIPLFGDQNYRGDFCGRGGYDQACLRCNRCHRPGLTWPSLEVILPGDDPSLDAQQNEERRAAVVADWLDQVVGTSARFRPDLPLVAPGDPDGSFIVMKVEASVPTPALGAPMPYTFEPLEDDQIETLRQWVAAGARND